MSAPYSHTIRKNGKNITLYRKFCELCRCEYIQESGQPEKHLHEEERLTEDDYDDLKENR